MSRTIDYKWTVPVGSIIKDRGLLYRVEEGSSCEECCFLCENTCICPMDYIARGFGTCSMLLRIDNKSVIYKIVGEDKDFKL